MLDTLTLASFEPHVGTEFAVTVAGYSDTLTLREAIAARGAAPGREAFSLTFHGARDDICFEQQILPLVHPVLGTLEIAVTPLGRNTQGNFRYHAVFN